MAGPRGRSKHVNSSIRSVSVGIAAGWPELSWHAARVILNPEMLQMDGETVRCALGMAVGFGRYL